MSANISKRPFVEFLFFSSVFFFGLASCSSPKNITYFQDLTDTSKIYTQLVKKGYEVNIQPDDIVEILINSPNSEATAIFNLGNSTPNVTAESMVAGGIGGKLNPNVANGISNASAATAKGYLVDKDGNIYFPVLGKIKVEGLTTSALKDTLKTRLDPYLKEPIVNARLVNYKITVVGEVARPSTYSIPSERITVVDAIGMAGDLTIYGRRENVLLVREENGERKFVRLNLNSSKTFESPYFYLKQNDVIYVEPNKSKVAATDISAVRNITIFTSVLTLLVVIASRIR